MREDGTALLALGDGLVAFAPGRPLRRLIDDPPWQYLYPNSAVLTPDGSRLFLGMRQYVAEVRLANGALRFLVPSRAFLNRLPKADARTARAQPV